MLRQVSGRFLLSGFLVLNVQLPPQSLEVLGDLGAAVYEAPRAFGCVVDVWVQGCRALVPWFEMPRMRDTNSRRSFRRERGNQN